MTDLPKFGIDVSEFNGDVDFAALKGQIDFAIIRLGYGGDDPGQDDTEYAANVRKCEAAGIPYGVYLYSYAKNREMALGEAAHTLRLLKGKKPLYGVWYDLEDPVLPVGEALADNVLAYTGTLKAAGYYCGVYASLSFWRDLLASPRLRGLDRWVAFWSGALDDLEGVGLWQYTNSGILNGQRFDFDRAYRDYPAIIGGKEETDMDREEVTRIAREEAQKAVSDNEERYPTVASLPQWAREPVERVYRELGLTGTGPAGEPLRLDASPTYVRTLTVIARVLEEISREKGRSKDPGQND